ncbi:MAG: inositol monophosphatase [Bryobacterales bacterium]|nr:inositol monophosphatase [Bryobacterales bacterium]
MTWEHELNTARALLLEAGRISLDYRRKGFQTEIKEDDSPVTEADKATEAFLVERLSEAFPNDGFLGEEGSSREGSSGRRWILDPIDGTKDYARGIHSYSNLLALEADGEVVVGLANHPVLGNLYSAAKGLGAWLHTANGLASALRTSNTDRFGRAVLGLNGINHLAGKPYSASILEFLQQFWAIRCFGGLEPVYVVGGQMDAFLSVTGKPWDYAPSKILIEEAGGCYFDFEGKSTIYAETCVVCNRALEAPIRRYFEQAMG